MISYTLPQKNIFHTDISSKNCFIFHVADIMLTPIKFDNYCRDNLALVEQFVNEYADEKMEWKICANMVANGKAQRETMADLIGKHDYPILDTCVSRSAVVDNALNLYKPVLKHRRLSSVAQDYLELAKELMEGKQQLQKVMHWIRQPIQ